MFKDGETRGRGDNVQKGIETSPESERLNQKIPSGPQTLGTEVPKAGLETLVSLCVSVSPRLGVFLADAKIVQR